MENNISNEEQIRNKKEYSNMKTIRMHSLIIFTEDQTAVLF